MMYVFVCVCVWEYSTCSLCVYSEGWSDPHTTCPVSVATNWISLDSQCWADRSVVEDRLFNISVAFTGQPEPRESYGDQPGADVFDWHHSLIRSAASTHSVSFQSHSCPFGVPHVLPAIYLSAALPEERACPHFNSAEVKRWWGKSEVSWFWCFAVNDGKLQCRRQWLEAWCTAARGRGEQREGDGKGYIITWHQFSSLCLRVCSCTYTHLSVSLTPFPACHFTLRLPQMWEMKRIGGVVFKCGNTLAKSATSINSFTCIQYARTRGKHFAIMLPLQE